MKKNTANQCFATIIVLLFIGTSFVSVSARFIVDDQSKSNILNEQRSDVGDIFFDLKMSFFMKLAKFPSLCRRSNSATHWRRRCRKAAWLA